MSKRMIRQVVPLVLLTGLAAIAASLPEAPNLKQKGWTPLLSGKDLSGWKPRPGKPYTWFATNAVHFNEAAEPKRLAASATAGPLIINGPDGRTADLLTEKRFGDMELYVEFMVPQKSNSGVYLHGLYEVQVFDSYGVDKPGVHDCGAIYERWINGKGVGGSPPRSNASRKPGEWQSFHVWFRAPRFDAHGKKTEDALFVRVVHNGVVVQENVRVDGPTRASMDYAEAPENPLMIQGDHGPVAYRNIFYRPLQSGGR